MKSRNLAKIVTLILSCALLIGAVVGISVVANESTGTTVAIKGANIAYEGAVQVVYYVDAQNIGDGTVKLVITDAEGNELKSKTHYVDYVKDEVTYMAFFSDGIAPKNLRQNVYAKAVVVDSEGAVVAESAVKEYSPYTYAMNRFGQSATPAQTELYKALLNYGAAVQAVLDPETAGTEANPWADEYWNVTIDGTEYTRGNLFDGTYTAERFNAEGDAFTGWTDAEDKPVLGWTNMTFKPGVATVLKSNYVATPAGLATFDDGTLGNATTNATAMANKVTDEDNKSSDAFYEIRDGYFVFEQYNDNDNGDSIKYPLTPAYATTYVYEADFNITEWDMSANAWLHKFAFWNSNGDEICNVTLTGSGRDAFTFGGKTFALNEWHHIKLVMTVAADGTLSATATLDGAATNGAGFQVGAGKDYRVANAGMALRNGKNCNTYNSTTLFDNVIAYTDGPAASYDLVLDANGGECAETYNVTMGAAYTLPTPVKGETPFVGWYIGDTLVEQTGTWNYIGSRTEKIGGKDVVIYGTAPTLVAKWATPVNVTLDANGGSVSSTSASVYAGQAYTLPTPERTGLIFGGWYDAEGNFYAAKGTSWAGETDVTLTAKWYVEISGNSNDFSNANALGGISLGTAAGSVSDGKFVLNNTGWNAQVYFPMSSDKQVFSGNTAGTKYIFEMDFTYVGGATASASGQEPAYIGFQNAADFSKYNGSQYSSGEFLKPSTTASEAGDADSVYMYGVQFMKGETYTVRFEQVVGNDKYVNVYVNGALVRTHQYNSVQGSVDPTQVVGFQFTFRRVGNFTFDNVYCGLIAPSVKSSFTLDAGYGALPENAQTEWTLMTGESYTLPTPTLDGFAFAGWSYGDAIIPASGTWAAVLDENATLVAKWLDTTTTTFEDATLANATKNFTVPNSNVNAVDAAGVRYIFTTDYTYLGMSAFTGSGTAEDPFVKYTKTEPQYVKIYTRKAGASAQNYAAVSTASGDIVNAKGEVVAPNGVLNDGLTLTKDEVFLSKLTWGGITYEIGQTYTLVITITMNNGGTPTVSVQATNKLTSEVKTGSISLKACDNIDYFRWEGRNAENACGSASNTFKTTNKFENVSWNVSRPVASAEITLDPNGGSLPEGAVDSFTLLTGMKLPELPTPNGGAYAFAGWYNGNALVNSGDVWTGGNATLVAKYLDTTIVNYDPVDATVGVWQYPFTYKTGNTDGQIDTVGTKYIYSFDFTYKGASYFTLNQETGAVAPVNGDHIGFFRLYAVQNPVDT